MATKPSSFRAILSLFTSSTNCLSVSQQNQVTKLDQKFKTNTQINLIHLSKSNDCYKLTSTGRHQHSSNFRLHLCKRVRIQIHSQTISTQIHIVDLIPPINIDSISI